MPEQVVKIARIGKDARSTDPNDFIFHSAYNTFKIIEEATKEVTLAASTNDQTFTQAHGLLFIPLVTAFAIETGVDHVFLPNSVNKDLWGPKLGWTSTGAQFNYIAADIDNVIFNFNNTVASEKTINIRYFLLEKI